MSEHLRNDQELRRLEELQLLRELGVNPYPSTFDKTHTAAEILTTFADDDPSPLASVSVAGRIMAIRNMGKASFLHLQDVSGRIQIYLKKDDLGDVYDHVKLYDIGDIIGVQGFAFRTRMGEISVHAQSVAMLCKSITVIPAGKEEVDAEVQPDVEEVDNTMTLEEFMAKKNASRGSSELFGEIEVRKISNEFADAAVVTKNGKTPDFIESSSCQNDLILCKIKSKEAPEHF